MPKYSLLAALAFAAALAAGAQEAPPAAGQAPLESGAAAEQAPEPATPAEDLLTLAPTTGFKYDSRDQLTPSHYVEMELGFDSERLDVLAQLYILNDGKYSPLESNQAGGTFFDYYAFLKSGGLDWRPSDKLSFRAGRLEHRDAVEGPYSLFVSSAAPAANILQIRFESDIAFYESRWIELNADSAMYTAAYPETPYVVDGHTGPFPDRGANFKTYGFKAGDMTFGLQDAAVYVGRSFDLEYFLSPLPQYFTQYVKGSAGRPWATGSNENDIIGAFWTWDRPDGLGLSAQFLMDDFSIFGLADTPNNPWKAAWALRAKVETSIGSFAFSHAGALKYTFEPTRDREDQCYSYTYYPDTRFTVDDPSDRSISLEDLMIGYKNGENNLAFRVDYEGSWSGFDIESYLEFVLSGAKSPTNAWQDEDWHDYEGSRLLDDPVLEKLLLFGASASRRFGDFVLSASFLVGGDFNALELERADASAADVSDKYETINFGSYIWKPGDENELVLSAGLFLRYEIPVSPYLRQLNAK